MPMIDWLLAILASTVFAMTLIGLRVILTAQQLGLSAQQSLAIVSDKSIPDLSKEKQLQALSKLLFLQLLAITLKIMVCVLLASSIIAAAHFAGISHYSALVAIITSGRFLLASCVICILTAAFSKLR